MYKLGKTFVLALFAVFAFSCSGEKESADNDSTNILADFSFSVDTVIIDPGEEIINLSQGIRRSALSENKKYLYVSDNTSTLVNKVNLDELKLESILQFEKEGPNGIGEYLSSFDVYPGEEFFFGSFRTSGLFNAQGEKIMDLTPKAEELEIEGIKEEFKYSLTNHLTLSSDKSEMYALPGDFLEGTRKLIKIDRDFKTGKLFDLPALEIAGQYRIVLQSNDAMSIYMEDIDLQKIDNHYFLTAGPTNKIYRFYPELDSLQLLEYSFSIVPNQKERPISNTVSSQEEFQSEMEKARTQIGFEKLIYDDKSERYYRFGRIYQAREDKEAPLKAQVFLFAFDKNLKLIGETEIPELDRVPLSAFFKDGKLWSYVNVNDELGFAVMDFMSVPKNNGRRNPSERDIKINNL